MGAVTSPGPRCPLPVPPPAQHLVCSKRGLIHLCPRSSSLLRGLFTVCECVNPVKEGGHGLWGPLSPPGPPELRPQEAEPPKSRLSPPQGAVQMGMGGFAAGCSPAQGSGGEQPHPPDPFALEHGVQPTFWGARGAQSHASFTAATHLGLRFLPLSPTQPGSVGSVRLVHALGPGPLGPPSAPWGKNVSSVPPIPHPPSQPPPSRLQVSQPCPIPSPQLAWIGPNSPQPTHPGLYKP